MTQLRAGRFARLADVAPVQDEPVVGVLAEFLRHVAQQLALDFERRLAGRKPGAVRDAEDMGIHGDGRLAERGVEDHVRGLATHAGQRFEVLARARHLAAVPVHQQATGRDDVRGLAVEEPDGPDVPFQPGFPQPQHLLRSACDGEQMLRSPC